MGNSVNPKIYLQIVNKKLRPLRGQADILDEISKSDSVIVSEIIQEFIEENYKNGELYYSREYTFDENKKLTIYKINICEDEDYEILQNGRSEFDGNKVYTLKDIEKYSVAKPKDEKESEKVKDEIIKATTKRASLLDEIHEKYPCPDISEGFYIKSENWDYLVRNIIRHQNTLLIGPTGTGKTEVVKLIADKLNIPCRVYDMGSMQDPLTDLLGSHRLENGTSIFDYAKFVSDVQTPGIIVLDELSRAPLMTNNILLPCLDGRRTLPVEIADSKSAREIKIHPEVIFVATANIGQEYAGTNEIDAALLNRFLPLQLEYMTATKEVKVLQVRTGINKQDATVIINFANKVRAEYMSQKLSKSVSTRETIAIAEMVVDGFSLVSAIEFIIAHKYVKNNFDDEYVYIKNLIMSC